MQRKLLIVLIIFSALSSANSQDWDIEINQGRAFLLHLGYGPQLPAADLKDRFGMNFSIDVAGDFITNDNWLFGAQWQYLFGNEVKEDVLVNLRTAEGFIIGNDRTPADIQLRQRGSYYGLRVGKLIGIGEKNSRAGLRVHLGAGILQHRIRIQDDPTRTVPQLTGDYRKGYDRLSNGLALHQFVGYQVLGKDGGVNFVLGLEFFEGFTQNRRDFDFDTRTQNTEGRLDLLIGLRASWTLPFYFSPAEDIYY